MTQDVTGLVERLESDHYDYGRMLAERREAAAALTAQAERIVELERELAAMKLIANNYMERFMAHSRDLAAAGEALTKFGRHDDDFCGIGLPNGECTCGLDAARSK